MIIAPPLNANPASVVFEWRNHLKKVAELNLTELERTSPSEEYPSLPSGVNTSACDVISSADGTVSLGWEIKPGCAYETVTRYAEGKKQTYYINLAREDECTEITTNEDGADVMILYREGMKMTVDLSRKMPANMCRISVAGIDRDDLSKDASETLCTIAKREHRQFFRRMLSRRDEESALVEQANRVADLTLLRLA